MVYQEQAQKNKEEWLSSIDLWVAILLDEPKSIVAFHWMSYNSLPLAELLLDKETSFFLLLR